MFLKTVLLSGAMTLMTLPAMPGDMTITIKDAYARSGAKSGAAFFTIMNTGDEDDRLIAVRSDASSRVELHTHIQDTNGVMKMREIEAGIEVPAGAMHALKRGGDHVMFMGLDRAFEQGNEVAVTLTFEKAGDVEVMIPVDNVRKAARAHSDQ